MSEPFELFKSGIEMFRLYSDNKLKISELAPAQKLLECIDISERKLLELLAHKLNMEGKTLALVEIRNEGTFFPTFDRNNHYTGSINAKAAIITYGVEK